MGLNGGGYTFINPMYLTVLTNDEVQALFTDKKSFLMRVRRTDFTQPYGILKQLPHYKSASFLLAFVATKNDKFKFICSNPAG